MMGTVYRVLAYCGWGGATFFLVWALAGCAGTQQNAGMTTASVAFCADEPGAELRICRAEIIDGKERRDVRLFVFLPNGATVDYQARDVRAFEAQAQRAAVERALIAETGQAAPRVVEAIIRALAP